MKYSGVLFFSFFFILFVYAEEAIVLPVSELGGCASLAECREYCDQEEHKDICAAFSQERELYHHVIGVIPGPDGCASYTDCRTYCAKKEHRKECTEFVKEKGLLPAEKIAKSFAYLDIIETFEQGPGGCVTEIECQEYCDQVEHLDECYAFARMNGFASRVDMIRAKARVRGGPGGCMSEAMCRQYCANMSRIAECLEFAAKNEFLDTGEAKKLFERLREYQTGCANLEACRNFCSVYPRECITLHAMHAQETR